MYFVKLIDKKEVAKETMAFYFEKPVGYTFVAGQHTGWTEINPAQRDAQGQRRALCYASAPHEEFLMFATRMRDTAFKNSLKNMAIGTELEIGDPRGNLVLPNNSDRPVVFLAGGIGITPFRSLVLDAADRKLPHKIFLFYSNRTVEEAAFLDELQKVDNPNFQFIPVFTRQTGHLTKDTVSKYVGDLAAPIYFIVGPPPFVLAMRNLLVSAGVEELSIKSEDFEGY